MTDESTPPPPSAEQSGPEELPPKVKQPKPKAQKMLPTERVAFDRQLDIIRAYGQLGATGRPVTLGELAKVLGLHSNTVSLANGFFTDIGLVTRGADGQVPAPEVIAYARAHEWDKDTSAHKLGPLLAATWFGQSLLPKVKFRPHTKQEALNVLADAAGASIEHKGQVESLLEFLEAGGLVTIDDKGTVNAVRQVDASKHDTPRDSQPPVPPTVPSSAFQFSMSVTMADIAGLPPEKIKTFFDGIALLMQAKADIDNNKAARS